MFSPECTPAQDEPRHLLLFTPVPQRRPSATGWTAERQRAFIAALARTGVVAAAARSVGLTARSAHQLRQRAGDDSGFARCWDRAVEQGRMDAIDEVIGRGFGPVREPRFYRGRQIGWRERHNDRLLYAALRGLDALASRPPAVSAQQSSTAAQRDCPIGGKTAKQSSPKRI